MPEPMVIDPNEIKSNGDVAAPVVNDNNTTGEVKDDPKPTGDLGGDSITIEDPDVVDVGGFSFSKEGVISQPVKKKDSEPEPETRAVVPKQRQEQYVTEEDEEEKAIITASKSIAAESIGRLDIAKKIQSTKNQVLKQYRAQYESFVDTEIEKRYAVLEKNLRAKGSSIEEYISDNNTNIAEVRKTIENMVRRDNASSYETDIERIEANAMFMLRQAEDEFLNIQRQKEEEKKSKERYAQDIMSKRTVIKDSFVQKILPKFESLGYKKNEVVETYNRLVKTMTVGKNTDVDSYVQTLEYGIIGALLPKKGDDANILAKMAQQNQAPNKPNAPAATTRESMSKDISQLGFQVKVL